MPQCVGQPGVQVRLAHPIFQNHTMFGLIVILEIMDLYILFWSKCIPWVVKLLSLPIIITITDNRGADQVLSFYSTGAKTRPLVYLLNGKNREN
jgi:hypothetical protein